MKRKADENLSCCSKGIFAECSKGGLVKEHPTCKSVDLVAKNETS